ncbi:hypothetical protein OY671_011893, partial [Metschnikowia pulcherrima]
RAARPPAGRGDVARILSRARHADVDAGRSGSDRRPAGRAAAGSAPRRAGAGAALREIRRRLGLRPDGAPWRHPHLPAAPRAQDDARRGQPARARRAGAALGGQRRRIARRRADRSGPPRAGRDHQRVLWPDRMQHAGVVVLVAVRAAHRQHRPRRAR